MGMDTGSNRGSIRSDINITPLVDVVLVLLIIFMVVTPMLQRGKHVELPKARHVATAEAGSPEPLFVSVTKEGKTYVESDEVTPDQLQQRMAEAGTRAQRVLVKADEETEYIKIRPVLDRASKAKLRGVSLAASELKGAK